MKYVVALVLSGALLACSGHEDLTDRQHANEDFSAEDAGPRVDAGLSAEQTRVASASVSPGESAELRPDAGPSTSTPDLPGTDAADAGASAPGSAFSVASAVSVTNASSTAQASPSSSALASASVSALPSASAQVPHATCGQNLQGLPLGFNNGVRAIAVGEDGTTYVGGTFNHAGPATGSGVPFDVATGEPLAAFPRVAGDVLAVVGDGAGGWFIGGEFTRVGDAVLNHLAHILNDGSVDATFPQTDARVDALAFAGGTLYVGGEFTSLGGVARARLAAVDYTGNLSNWAPDVELINQPPNNLPARVLSLLLENGTLYVGGNFNRVGDQVRTNLASFQSDGSLTAWDPNVSYPAIGADIGNVRSIARVGDRLYIGGEFESVSGVAHRALASFDENGNVSAWTPEFGTNSVVEALDSANGVLYVAGYFSAVGDVLRGQLAAFDSSGQLTDWNPKLSAGRTDLGTSGLELHAISVVGSTVYVGGGFRSGLGPGGAENLAAADTAGNALPWNPMADGPVFALAHQGNTLYAGGQFDTLCGEIRNHVAAIDPQGKLTDFNPNVSGTVSALATQGDLIYIGGFFGHVGGEVRTNLAAVTRSGALTAWSPLLSNYDWIYSILAQGDTIFVGGHFLSIGSEARRNLAAIKADGTLLAWSPFVDSYVYTLTSFAGQLIVGGLFLNIDGKAHSNLAAFDADLNLLDWNPTIDNPVDSFAVSNNTLYVAGEFRTIDGQARGGLAAFDSDKQLLNWASQLEHDSGGAYASSIALADDTLYVTGYFTSVAGSPRSGLAAFDSNGTLLPWNPGIVGLGGRVIARVPGGIGLGGNFNALGDQLASGFALLNP